jgi:hypothetical protein
MTSEPIGLRQHIADYVDPADSDDAKAFIEALVFTCHCVRKYAVEAPGLLLAQKRKSTFKHELTARVRTEKILRHLLHIRVGASRKRPA